MTEQLEGPGAALKTAREALNVSVREVADALNLPLHVVEAIEANDYDRLPQAVFTRGYLRSYARLLELDSEAIVSSYPEAEVADVTLTAEVEIVPPASEWWRLRPAWLVGGGVGLVVIVLVVLISLLRTDGTSESSSVEVSDTTQAPQPSPDVLPSAGSELDVTDDLPAPVEQSAAVGQDLPVERGPQTDDAVDAAAPETTAREDSFGADLTASADSTTQADLDSEPAEQTETAEATRSDDEPSGQAEAVQSRPAPVAAAQSTNEAVTAPTPAGMRRITPFGDDVLVIGFAEDCWVEIKDAEGAALYGDLNRGGATLRVVGRAPFRVLLGYAPGVEMTFNGRAVEVTRYTRNNVASITVGG